MIKTKFNRLQILTMNSLKVQVTTCKLYKVQVDCLKESESNFHGKNDMKEKVNDLVRLHKAI